VIQLLGSGGRAAAALYRHSRDCVALHVQLEGRPIGWKQKAKDAARRRLNEVVISSGLHLFERIAASAHNAFNRVIASRADKQLLLVMKTVIRMRTASR
jgi:hypothetical protein